MEGGNTSGVNEIMKRRCSLFAVFCSLFIVYSCQTAPSAPEAPLGDSGFIPLEPGGYVYMIADQDASPIIRHLGFWGDDRQIQQMVDLTQFAVAAVYRQPAGEAGSSVNRYRLAAWGDYPVSRAKMALGASKDWKKQRSAVSGDQYWHSAEAGISVAITPGRALVSTAAGNQDSSADPFSALPGTAIPEGFNVFRREAVFSCWLDNPALVINQRLEEMGIPIELPAERLFIGLCPADEERYQARLRMQFSSAAQAKALATIFTFARNFLPSADSGNVPPLALILFANPPVPDGNNLDITSAPLSAGEISLLFRLFSL